MDWLELVAVLILLALLVFWIALFKPAWLLAPFGSLAWIRQWLEEKEQKLREGILAAAKFPEGTPVRVTILPDSSGWSAGVVTEVVVTPWGTRRYRLSRETKLQKEKRLLVDARELPIKEGSGY